MNPAPKLELAEWARVGDQVMVKVYVAGNAQQIGVLTFRSRDWYEVARGNVEFSLLKPIGPAAR